MTKKTYISAEKLINNINCTANQKWYRENKLKEKHQRYDAHRNKMKEKEKIGSKCVKK